MFDIFIREEMPLVKNGGAGMQEATRVIVERHAMLFGEHRKQCVYKNFSTLGIWSHFMWFISKAYAGWSPGLAICQNFFTL